MDHLSNQEVGSRASVGIDRRASLRCCPACHCIRVSWTHKATPPRAPPLPPSPLSLSRTYILLCGGRFLLAHRLGTGSAPPNRSILARVGLNHHTNVHLYCTDGWWVHVYLAHDAADCVVQSWRQARAGAEVSHCCSLRKDQRTDEAAVDRKATTEHGARGRRGGRVVALGNH